MFLSNFGVELCHCFSEVADFLKDDFDTDLAWMPLKNKCLEINEGHYIYKLCLFDKASQIDSGGGPEINLG